jgi:hypothetical protein
MSTLLELWIVIQLVGTFALVGIELAKAARGC